MRIQDANTGQLAKVDLYGRQHTFSLTRSEISDVSIRGNHAYSITTENMLFNSTNEHPWFYLCNRNADLTVFFSSIIYSYNGGNTNFNRSMVKRVYRNPPAPTGRYQEIEPANLNMGSNNSAIAHTYGWDGSGDGMEVDLTSTVNLSTSTVPQGYLTLGEIGGVILPFNTSLLFSFEPEEIGYASISMKIFFNNETSKL